MSTVTRQPRPSRRSAAPIIPLGMVRAAAFLPSPPIPTPVGQKAVLVRCEDPIMPVGVSQMQIIYKSGAVGALAPIIAATLYDATTIEVLYSDAYSALGVYVPYNDPGFRGINGGMINPGELSARLAAPGAFPWCCAIG